MCVYWLWCDHEIAHNCHCSTWTDVECVVLSFATHRVCAVVNYCSSVLAGVSRHLLVRLQSVLNVTVWLTLSVMHSEHITHFSAIFIGCKSQSGSVPASISWFTAVLMIQQHHTLLRGSVQWRPLQSPFIWHNSTHCSICSMIILGRLHISSRCVTVCICLDCDFTHHFLTVLKTDQAFTESTLALCT